MQIEIFVGGEALAGLFGQVAVGHRMAYQNGLPAETLQDAGEIAGGLRLADAGPHRGDRDHRLLRLEHRAPSRAHAEVWSPGGYLGGAVHHVFVLDVGVGEPDLVDVVSLDELPQLGFRPDRHPVGVELAGELGRVDAFVDVGDLCRSEGDHLIAGVVAKERVEVVEVPPGGAHDDDLGATHFFSSPFSAGQGYLSDRW